MYEAWADVLLQNVVLNGPAQLRHGNALLLRRHDVHGPDDGRRAVDGHGSGHLVLRYAVEEYLHVTQRGNGHTALAELPPGLDGVGVIADQRGIVEGGAEARLTVAQQVPEACVGLLRRSEAGEHAHGPQPAPVTGGMDGPGEGVTGWAGRGHRIGQVLDIQRCIHPLQRHARPGGEPRQPLGSARNLGVRQCRLPLQLLQFRFVKQMMGVQGRSFQRQRQAGALLRQLRTILPQNRARRPTVDHGREPTAGGRWVWRPCRDSNRVSFWASRKVTSRTGWSSVSGSSHLR